MVMTVSLAKRIMIGFCTIAAFMAIYMLFVENMPYYALFYVGFVFFGFHHIKSPGILLIKKMEEMDEFLPEMLRSPYYWSGIVLMAAAVFVPVYLKLT